MHVVRHHNIRMELVVSHVPLFMVDGFDYHLGELRLEQVQRTRASGVEKAVHRQEGLAGGGRRGESAVRREAAMQTPGEEDGLSDGVIVRQAATMEGGHEERVGGEGEYSQQCRQAD